MGEMNSQVEEILKLRDNLAKMAQWMTQIQQQRNATAIERLAPASGYIGRLCKRCFAFSVISIPPVADHARHLLTILSSSPSSSMFSAENPFPAAWSPYDNELECKGSNLLIGDQAKVQQQYKVDQELALTRLLYSLVRSQLQGGTVFLVARKIDSALLPMPSAIQRFKVSEVEVGSLAAMAISIEATAHEIRALRNRENNGNSNDYHENNKNATDSIADCNNNCEGLSISYSDLWKFLHCVKATVGIFEVPARAIRLEEGNGNSGEDIQFYSLAISFQHPKSEGNELSAKIDEMITNYMRSINSNINVQLAP